MDQNKLNEHTLNSLAYLLDTIKDQNAREVKQILELSETKHRLQHVERQVNELLEHKEIEKKTFEAIQKMTMEKIKNGDIHKPSSKQTDKATIRGTCYILL